MEASPTSYSPTSRALHWATAGLVLAAIAVVLYARSLPFDSDAAIARKALLFSAHKTLGLAALGLGIGRLALRLIAPRPAPLAGHRRWEVAAAALTHDVMTVGLILVPLSGWAHHAATEGYAPILWPFGQNLPLIPESEAAAALFKALHWVLTKVLIAAVILHVAGAVKHAAIDRDGTLGRMLTGRAAKTGARAPGWTRTLALALWGVAVAGGLGLAFWPKPEAPVAEAWTATGGTATLASGGVRGEFGAWTAALHYAPGEGVGTLDFTGLTGSLDADPGIDPAFAPTVSVLAKLTGRGDALSLGGGLALGFDDVEVEAPATLESGDGTLRLVTTLSVTPDSPGLAEELHLGLDLIFAPDRDRTPAQE